jgi:hypothetical protein
MRVPMLSAIAAVAAVMALPAAAHGWEQDRDDSVVMVRECPLPAPAAHHHVGHVAASHHRGRAAVRCQVAEATPVEEHVVRIYHHEDVDACADRDRCGDRDRDDGWRDQGRDGRGADRDRGMDQDHAMAMRHDDGDRDRYGDHDMTMRHDDGDRDQHEDHEMVVRRDDGDRGMRDDRAMAMRRDGGDRQVWDDRSRGFVDGSVHREAEDRRGWDDHEYAQRDDGMRRDDGDARSHVYYEERERTFEHGEHWVGQCGCGPARPTATDDDGYLVWAGKVAPEDGGDRSWDVHP